MSKKADYNMELVESLRSLSPAEYRDLEESCKTHGILDPLKTWKGYLVDGRHRLKISDKHRLAYREEEMEFADLEEARAWVLTNQLGKRNLTEIEVQRARAALAKMTSIEEAAQEYGVSERTIQRDVEAVDSMDLMPEDLREKCERGEIINSRADWKRYADLTDSERDATDRKLRDNPSMTMRDALPEKKNSLTAYELEALNAIPSFTPQLKRSIAAGNIQTDSASVKKILELPPDRQELLAAILSDPQVDSLKKGLNVLSGTAAPRTRAEAIQIANSSILPLTERISERLKDLEAFEIEASEAFRLLGLFVTEVTRIK